MSKKSQYIIKTTLGFLRVSGGFSSEYPEAVIFDSRRQAYRAALELPSAPEGRIQFEGRTIKFYNAEIIKDYGMDTEETESL